MQSDLFGLPAYAAAPALARKGRDTLRDTPLSRVRDPQTSKAAAAAAGEAAKLHQQVVLATLEWYGPLGKDGIAARAALTGVQVCRRLTELHRAGLIVPTGRNVPSTAGRAEREWRLT